jgi:hypothetical protein
MPTTRTPRRRHNRRRITAEAIEAFRRGDVLALHRALGLKPWEISPIDIGDDGEHPPGGDPYEASAGPALALRRDLAKAAGITA